MWKQPELGNTVIWLRGIDLRVPAGDQGYPFTLNFLQQWQPLDFHASVTFFVGENGSGKSTLLEALALASDMITVGSLPVQQDASLDAVRPLAKALKMVWNQRVRRGFFLRSEDFFGWVRAEQRSKAEMQSELEDVGREFGGRSDYAQALASGPLRGQLAGMQRRYGNGLEQRSHGESFLDLFQARFRPDGLYLLDEPEVPLSPLRQLSLLSLLKDMVAQGAQFVIATHSPILMAFPGAEIISFDSSPLQRVRFDELEHVKLTRDFLANPDSFLQHL